jgi:hypothetical protein
MSLLRLGGITTIARTVQAYSRDRIRILDVILPQAQGPPPH